MDNSKLVEKIQALLNKANDKSVTPEESQSFLLGAQRLMMKYSIEQSEVDKKNNVKKEVIMVDVLNKKNVPKIISLELIKVICKNFKVDVIICENVYKLIGLKGEVELAASIYNMALDKSEKVAYKIYRETKSRDEYTSYLKGFNKGLKTKFEEQVDKSGWGLILIKDEAISNWKRQKTAGVKQIKGKDYSMKHDSFMNGYNDGNKFQANKQISK